MHPRLAALTVLLLASCTRELTLPPPPGPPQPGTIYGHVVYAQPGQAQRQPAVGATVELLGTSATTTTGADGNFLLKGITQQTGTLLIRFDPAGNGKATRQRLIKLEDINAGPGRQIALGDIPVVENGRMHGRAVLGDQAQKPTGHGNTTVFVPSGPFTTYTNDDGSYALTELPEGKIRITLFHQGYDPVTLDDLNLRSGEDFAVRDVVLKAVAAPPPPGSIAGHVAFIPAIASATGTVVAAIDSTGKAIAGTIDSSGTFHVAQVEASLYDLTVARDGYLTAIVHHVLVSSGAEVVLPEVVLQAGKGTTECNPGDSCAPRGSCRTGAIDCSTGAPVCKEIGNAKDGTVCGVDQVCAAGNCTACAAGGNCTPANTPCHDGVFACDTGAQVCIDRGTNVSNGAACGAGQVCNTGVCVACVQGLACTPADQACHGGAIECGTGSPVCKDTLANVANGVSCGKDQVCNGGTCTACAAGAVCTPTVAPCHAGVFACNTGVRICIDQHQNLDDGTNCGQDLVCRTGGCVACVTGASCVPASGPCHVGVTSCTTGISVCIDTNAPQTEGAACGTGLVCHTGSCVPSGFSVVTGDGQSADVEQPLPKLITVRIADQNGAPIAATPFTITAPPGGVALPAAGTTNAQGRITFSARLPRATGDVNYTVASTGLGQIALRATATTPAAGTIFTLVNADHVQGYDTVGAGVAAHVGTVRDLAIAADGSIYFTDSDYHGIRKLSPKGELSVVAGTPPNYGNTGDGGLATKATLNTPSGVALDEKNGFLYFSDSGNHVVRSVEFATGLISTVVGTLSSYGSTGDGGAGIAAKLYSPTHLVFGPDGLLYITDRGNERIRRYDPASGLLKAWLTPTPALSCTSATVFYQCSGWSYAGCQVIWDAAGDAYVGAGISGNDSATACNLVPGILRVNHIDGSLTRVAGRTNGSFTDGVAATEVALSSPPLLALDAGGNLFFSDTVGHLVRRIESITGRVTTQIGSGTAGFSGEDAPALGAQVNQPNAIAFDASRNLFLADAANFSVRSVAGAGSSSSFGGALSMSDGDGQSAIVEASPTKLFSVKLVDGGGAPLSGYSVRWSAIDAGSVIGSAVSKTDRNGIATASGRAGRTAGPYHFSASYFDVQGNHIQGSPLTFTLTATAAPTGTIYSIVNSDHVEAPPPAATTPGSISRIGTPTDVALATDGTVYFTDPTYHVVEKLSPQGALSIVAGTSNSAGYSGDGGPATQAKLYGPWGLTLDPSGANLYFSDRYNNVIRAVSLATGAISTVAGGGTAPAPGYGDGGAAGAASFYYPTHVAFGPDGLLYVTDFSHGRIRRVNLTTGSVDSWVPMLPTSSCASPISLYNCTSAGDGGCQVQWDPAGNAFVSGYLCGTLTAQSGTAGIIRLGTDGTLGWVAGFYNGATGDGGPAQFAKMTNPASFTFDGGGNLLYADAGSHVVRRIESQSRRITTLAGTGVYGSSLEYVLGTKSPLYTPWGLKVDTQQNVIFADYNNYALRTLASVGSATALGARLAVSGGSDTQTALVDQSPGNLLAAKLVDAGGAPLSGYPVQWTALDSGSAIVSATSLTDTSGVATAQVRAGLSVGAYRFQASYTDIHGAHIPGSPALFTITASGPASGTIFTAIGIDHTSQTSGLPGPGTLERLYSPRDLAVAADGSIYFADYNNQLIEKLSPAGDVTIVAGITGSGGAAGDGNGGLATAAHLNGPVGVALDQTAGLLYIAEYGTSLIRTVNLASGIISTFAGGGSALAPGYGDGGPASSATLYNPTHVAIGPDGIYITDYGHERIRRVNGGVISNWLSATPGIYCTSSQPIGFYNCSSASYDSCHVLWDAAGNAYVSGLIGGLLPTSGGSSCALTPGILRVNKSDGSFTHIAGHVTGSTADGAQAAATLFASAGAMALDTTGNLFLADYSGNRIRKIDASAQTISTIAGDGTAAFRGEGVASTTSEINGPWMPAVVNGHLLFSDSSNSCLRVVW